MPTENGASDEALNCAGTLVRLGDAIFGDSWPSSVARLTGVSLRTIQRINAQCAMDEPHPRSGYVLNLFREKMLSAMSHTCDEFSPYGEPESIEQLYEWTDHGLDNNLPLIAVSPEAIAGIRSEIAAGDERYWRLLVKVIEQTAHLPRTPNLEAWVDEITDTLDDLDLIYGIDQTGMIHLMSQPVHCEMGDRDSFFVETLSDKEINAAKELAAELFGAPSLHLNDVVGVSDGIVPSGIFVIFWGLEADLVANKAELFYKAWVVRRNLLLGDNDNRLA